MILATNSNTETDLQSNIASSIKATNQKALLTKKLLQALKKSYEKFKSTSSDVKVQSAGSFIFYHHHHLWELSS